MLCYYYSSKANHVISNPSFPGLSINVCNWHYKHFVIITVNTQGTQMPQPYNNHVKEALLIYEEVLGSYKFKFVRGFSRQVIDIIKTGIPTNERTTSGPPDWEWYFKEQYFQVVKLALDGTGFVTKIITKEDIEKLKAQQVEQQKNTPPNYGQMFKPAGYSIDNELNKFQNLLVGASQTSITLNEVKNWTKDLATKAYRKAAQYYHPDKSPALAHMMSELNTTWTILKEGYYIK